MLRTVIVILLLDTWPTGVHLPAHGVLLLIPTPPSIPVIRAAFPGSPSVRTIVLTVAPSNLGASISMRASVTSCVVEWVLLMIVTYSSRVVPTAYCVGRQIDPFRIIDRHRFCLTAAAKQVGPRRTAVSRIELRCGKRTVQSCAHRSPLRNCRPIFAHVKAVSGRAFADQRVSVCRSGTASSA